MSATRTFTERFGSSSMLLISIQVPAIRSCYFYSNENVLNLSELTSFIRIPTFPMYNCHTHLFSIAHVPVNFLPWPVKILADHLVTSGTVKLLEKLQMKGLAYRLRRFVVFKKIGELGDQKDIFKHLMGFYPENAKFVVLSMDMAFMAAGKTPESFENQLNTLAELKQEYQDQIIPFVFAHPERKDLLNIIQDRINKDQFGGIKLYPALGYFPSDDRLDRVFAWAETHQIPVMTHCARGGVYFKGQLTDERRTDPADGTCYPKAPNRIFTDQYSNPDRYELLLTKYPKLKLCFAHYGGDSEWDKYLDASWEKGAKDSWYYKINELIRTHDNVYTDISYTLFSAKYYGLLKVSLQDPKLRTKILFGTDYYMQEQETSERSFGINLRAYLGTEDFNQIAITNAALYLQTN